VLLFRRVPDDFYKMVMCLSLAGRLLFRPSRLTPGDLDDAERELVKFLDAFYKVVYRGIPERLRVCRFMFAVLLDVVPNVRQCGPIWCYWQFPLERYIGTLPPMIRSRSRPHEALVQAMEQHNRAELLLAFATRECPDEWAAAAGTVGGAAPPRRWELPLPNADATDITVLRPIDKPQELHGAELVALRRHHEAVADADPTPRKFYRLELTRGAIINARDSLPQDGTDRRRTSLVRIQSSARRRAPNGGVETYRLATYGLVQHFLLCQGPTGLVALAFVRSIVSQRDPTGLYGIPEDCRDMHVFSSYEGTHRYIDALSILDSVGCLTWGDRHYIMFTREPFSTKDE